MVTYVINFFLRVVCLYGLWQVLRENKVLKNQKKPLLFHNEHVFDV